MSYLPWLLQNAPAIISASSAFAEALGNNDASAAITAAQQSLPVIQSGISAVSGGQFGSVQGNLDDARSFANQASQDSMLQQQDAAAFSSSLANDAANLSAERALALNQQANMAATVADQLNALTRARETSAASISEAMRIGAGMFAPTPIAAPARAYRSN